MNAAGEYLTQYINHLAGDKPTAQWFHRRDNGSGVGLQGINLSQALQDRHLDQQAFPDYMLNAHCHDELHSFLIVAFFQWQAPWLLLLPGLAHEQRRSLEQHAQSQALVVDKRFRLYPDVIDEALIKAAIVEAMIRKGQQQEKSEEEAMSTFYIELHPSPTQ